MKTLEEVQAVFPTAKYPPKEGCRKCDGDGMYDKDGRTRPCLCVFVGAEFADEIGEMMSEHARNMRNDPKAIDDMAKATVKFAQNLKNGKVDDK